MGAMNAEASENSRQTVDVPLHPKTGKPMPIGRKFQPGQSGNPGGRPRVVADIRELCQQEGGNSWQTIVAIRDDPKAPAAARLAAAMALWDRGYGKAIQRQELSGPDGAPIQVQQVPDDRPVLDGFLVEFTEQKAVEGSVVKEESE